jgi:hypothetical protein
MGTAASPHAVEARSQTTRATAAQSLFMASRLGKMEARRAGQISVGYRRRFARGAADRDIPVWDFFRQPQETDRSLSAEKRNERRFSGGRWASGAQGVRGLAREEVGGVREMTSSASVPR